MDNDDQRSKMTMILFAAIVLVVAGAGGAPMMVNDVDHAENEIDGVDNSDDLGEPLNEIDFYNANLLNLEELNAKMAYSEDEDPILKAKLFEGDIDRYNRSSTVLTSRNAIINSNVRWSNGVIPYTIAASFSSFERSVIARAMSEYHSKTCVQFAPRKGDGDYIHIMKGNGCSSSVGRQGGGQQVSLGGGCVYFGIVVHELMHAVGFWHEQSREDRDQYIQIVWNNIQRGMEYNFQKYSWKYIQDLGENYDLSSVMHYEAYAFASDRSQPTIIAKDTSRSRVMGQRNGFSTVDVRKINTLYKCSGGGGGGGGEEVVVKPVVPTKENCVDSHSRCQEWSSQDECDKNPAWMKVNCLKSCKICVGEACKDSNSQCPHWSGIGECDKNPSYMHNFCKKSCGTC